MTLDILDWGSASKFNPTAYAGTAWELDNASLLFTHPAGIGPLLQQQLLDTYLQIDEVDDQRATFRLISNLGAGDCVVLRDEGAWEGSALVYQRDEITAEDDAGTVYVGQDPELRLSWSSASDQVDVYASLVADVSPFDLLSQNSRDGATCDLMDTFGVTCQACDNGATDCVEMRAYHGRMDLLAEPFGNDVAMCGIDALEPVEPIETPPISCDPNIEIDCSCSNAGGVGPQALLIGLLTLLRRRRSS
jgi:uncharacterized protein (TIGR03382 family)